MSWILTLWARTRRLLIAFGIAVGLLACDAASAQEQPNVVLIVADDLGWSDVGYNGAAYYETPNIDRLASEGLTFTSAYSAGPNCAPTRASLISGMYPPRHDIYQPGGWSKGDPRRMKLLTPVRDPITSNWPKSFRSVVALDSAIVSVAEVLKPAGYATARFGKWHVGPDVQGFDLSSTTGAPGATKSQYGSATVAQRLTDAGIRFIEEHQKRPFFLFLSHWDVHGPLNAVEDVVEKYRKKLDRVDADGRDYLPVYAAMVEAVDRSVGHVLRTLEELGLSENTLVIFSSDNGGVARFTYNDPLRGGKGSLFEGGIRIPFVAKWPGVIQPGTTTDVPIHSIDLLPTLADLGGASLPDGKQMVDGISIRPLLEGAPRLQRDALFWHFPHYLSGEDRENFVPHDDQPALTGEGWRTTPAGAVRQGRWKLIEFFEDGELMLFDVEADRGEERNLVGENPAVAADLRRVLHEWQDRTDAPVPAQRNPYYAGE